MEVRLARASDLPVLAELVIGFRDHLGATRPTREALETMLPALIDDPATELALAWSGDGDALGYSNARRFASLWACAPEVHLEDLYVVPAVRGRGVGGALLEAVVARAREHGAVAVGLHTNEHNERAQAFYRRVGFTPATEARWDGGRELYWVREL